MNTENIDFVITWVDGTDIEWQKAKNKAKGLSEGDGRISRYRDWDTLKYWFRGVEKYAPWVHKVYLVTCGHYPVWLNLNNPKLQLVTHQDFIPSKYLPTFSCRPIEFNLHRIAELSDMFVYFNDDMFLTNTVEETDFFKNGLPCDSAILDAQSPEAMGKNGERLEMSQIYSSLYYNTAIINRNFDKRKTIRDNLGKWLSPAYGKMSFRTFLLYPWRLFTGFKSDHLPYSYLKTTYEKVWQVEGEVLDKACMHKFREPFDVSSRILSYWQIAEGLFSPRSPKIGLQTYLCNDDLLNERVFEAIKSEKYKMICVNDEYSGDDFDRVKGLWIESFETILPHKSKFER